MNTFYLEVTKCKLSNIIPTYPVSTSPFRLTKEEIDELEREIAGFLIEYRKYFKTVPPKVHILEDHVIPQLRKLGWSMGIGSEQGGEASHKLVKAVRQRFFNKSQIKTVYKEP